MDRFAPKPEEGGIWIKSEFNYTLRQPCKLSMGELRSWTLLESGPSTRFQHTDWNPTSLPRAFQLKLNWDWPLVRFDEKIVSADDRWSKSELFKTYMYGRKEDKKIEDLSSYKKSLDLIELPSSPLGQCQPLIIWNLRVLQFWSRAHFCFST